MLRRIFGYLFLALMLTALVQCARRGSPSGGPKDETPPVLLEAQPENMTVNFKTDKIRLYFDEYIKLKDVQEQLIISPPLKNRPEITPQGGARKYIEIILKDTLKDSTTYTFNFGQSVVDNNEENPYSFFNYVFSTGSYVDSLSIIGVITDALNEKADNFVSVMLYEMDSTYTDSTVYKSPPTYITNTLDSTNIFKLNNLKAGKYALFALKDEGKNNMFDQKIDKIGYLGYPITIPTDSIFALNMFKEISDYSAVVPSFTAKNKIVFGYYGEGKNIKIETLTPLPDSVRTKITKEPKKDTLNYWITDYKADSLMFRVINEAQKAIDTFIIKPRKLAIDTMVVKTSGNSSISIEDPFYITSNTPIHKIDTSKIEIINKDSVRISLKTKLDSIGNKLDFNLDIPKEDNYNITVYPEAITDFFGNINDTLVYNLSPKDETQLAVIQLDLVGAVTYPAIVQLLDQSKKVVREIFASTQQTFTFKNVNPATYNLRVISDTNGNRKWDTGNYLKKQIPEKVSYYPEEISLRAYSEEKIQFEIIK